MSNETTTGPYKVKEFLGLQCVVDADNIILWRSEDLRLSEGVAGCMNIAFAAGQASREQQAHPQTEDLEAGIKLACDRIDSVIIDAIKKAVTVNGDLNSIDRSVYRSAVWNCIEQSMNDAHSLSPSKGVDEQVEEIMAEHRKWIRAQIGAEPEDSDWKADEWKVAESDLRARLKTLLAR